MAADLAFDLVLALLLVGVAGFAVAARSIFAAIMFFIVYGILIAIAWVRLESVDVALAEVAIGAGLTGVLLVGTMARLGGTERRHDPDEPSRLSRGLTGALCAAVAGILIAAVVSVDAESPGLLPLVSANLVDSGSGNPVTAVLLNFRAYDTLLESVVLLTALIAIWSLTPDALWGDRPGLRQHARPHGVLATFGRVLPPAGLMIGIYLVWAGTDAAGGAFQGGTVLAAVLLLAYMAGLVEFPPSTSTALRAAAVAGPAFFLAVGLSGAILAAAFLALPVAWAKPAILAIELALAGSIAVILALVVAGIPRRAP